MNRNEDDIIIAKCKLNEFEFFAQCKRIFRINKDASLRAYKLSDGRLRTGQSGNFRGGSVNKSDLYSELPDMVMAKRRKGGKNNKVRYFLFYYPSTLNSRNACPRTSISNMPVDRSERKA
jgi:hypothetical protein